MADSPANWYDDDSFWERWYPFMFPDVRFADAVDQIPFLEALTGMSGGRVLDLACGPGRFVVPYARRGYTVTGVDRTPYLLQKAAAYAAEQQVDVELVQMDMREYVSPDTFDLALNLFTSFGYFPDPADNQRVLDNVYASLKPGGAFVVDVMGKEVLARIFRPADVEEHEDGTLFVQQRAAVNDWCEMESKWILIRDGAAQTFHVRHWLYSGWELKQMLYTAGFAEVALYGDLDGAVYGPQARRLIAVARK